MVFVIVFAIFAFSWTRDPELCYVVTTEDDPRLEHDIAVTYIRTQGDATNEAALFKAWFVTGVFLGAINTFIYIGDAIMKLKHYAKGHGICNMLGVLSFVLALAHVIWIAILRFRHYGRVASGDFRSENEEDPESNYLIVHGRFALVYCILTLGTMALVLLATIIFMCFLCATLCSVKSNGPYIDKNAK